MLPNLAHASLDKRLNRFRPVCNDNFRIEVNNNGEFLISFLQPFLQFMKSSDHHSRQTYAVVVAWQGRGNEVSKSIILQTV